MNVLIIHNAGDLSLPSGELAVAKAEVKELLKNKTSVHLHVVTNVNLHKLFSVDAFIAGVNIFWSYASYQNTKKLIEKYQPDIVHFHGILPLLTPSVFHACKKKGIPVVQTLHNFRWVCIEGGLFRDNRYCESCIKNSGWQGLYYRCCRGSRPISFILWLVNLFYKNTGLLYSWVDQFIAVSQFVKEKYT